MGKQARFFGQFDEDRLLAQIFEDRDTAVCVDVGANDGITGSVSYYFENQGWHCVLIEPNPELCDRLRKERSSFVFEGAASSSEGTATLMLAEGEDLSHAISSIEPGSQSAIARQGLQVRAVDVQTAPLDLILEQAGVAEQEIAFVSIDVEGHEFQVLRGFTLSRWQPKILIIEDNSLFLGNDIGRFLKSHGYVRFLRTGVNDWYAAADFVGKLSSKPERDYLSSMIRARGLMLRRLIVRQAVDLPFVGTAFSWAIRAVRG